MIGRKLIFPNKAYAHLFQQSKLKTNDESSIPVSFVRRSHGDFDSKLVPSEFLQINKFRSRKIGHANLSGWDIIVPLEFSREIWLKLQFAGTNAIGLQEFQAIYRESCETLFPNLYPDTNAGCEHWKSLEMSVKAAIKKMPKNNTSRCLSALQSYPNFDLLLGSTNDYTFSISEAAFVRSDVFLLPFLPTSGTELNTTKEPLWKKITRGKRTDGENVSQMRDVEFPHLLPFNTLVSVCMRSAFRGIPKPGALIYVPSDDDLSFWSVQTEKGWRGRKVCDADNNLIIIGMIAEGSHSLLTVGGVAIGWCKLEKIYQCLNLRIHECRGLNNRVLWKNSGSNMLRPGFIKIIL